MASSELPDADRRPSPDALLAAAKAETRGRLKIFLGAAPGVGKTYEMLQAARRKRAEGVDVVVGVVETHGRRETEAMLEGLEVLPRRAVPYKGKTLQEMDVDALLKRRPKLALVDELAHSNAPGSRHLKRFQDVEDLLAAGLDVYATLNIQHIESLNDVVARITRIRVRETVPDSVIDRADEIEIIDITPEELIKRLKEGKVYVREAAERAVRHYFQPGNITALRELALRRTAERVDEQMVDYMRAHAIQGPWAAGERVLVCVNERPNAEGAVRYAKRVADRLRAPWQAVYIEGPRHARLSEAERDRIAKTLRLAERLGADTRHLPGERIADALLAYARDNNITQIVLAKSSRSRWFELLHGSVVRELAARAGSIVVQIVPGETQERPAEEEAVAGSREPFNPWRYVRSLLLVAAATGIGEAVQTLVNIQSLSLIYLAAVLISAIRDGLVPALATALLSSLAYNFFFTPPLYTLTVTDPENVVALAFFTLTALLTGGLAGRARIQAEAARHRAAAIGELYSFSRKLAGIAAMDDLLWASAHQIASMLKVEVVLLTPKPEGLAVRAGFPPEDRLDDADLAAAQWSWDHNRAAGRGSDTLPGAKRLFLPMGTASGKLGVVGITRAQEGALLTSEQRRLLDALIDQIAVAMERVRLAEDVDEARVLSETERLRAALLTSISHDLRTPLATIMGTISSLRTYGALYDEATREEMLASAQEEGERLNRFVANLLDMTRLDTGALELKREPVDLGDLIGTALRRSAPMIGNRRVEVAIEPGLPLLPLDFVLMEQVLVNLLDNAAKYSPPKSRIDIRAKRSDGEATIEIMDEGTGIPDEALERIFDKFFRVKAADRQRAGTGLGLAICRGFVEAMGGTIVAGNRPDRPGAVFRITLPLSAVPEPAATATPA
jgi:two-component system sensor histidine kinase KdpD